MPWDTLTLWGSAGLSAALLLLPLVTALRFPAALPWPRALLVMGAALLVALALTLVLALALSLLYAVAPGWNPYSGPAFESVDAGLFQLFLSVFLALVVTVAAQFWWLRSLVKRSGTS
ncbi:hypothetical protein [Deinococcus multiflagellatus]|uniref:Uncharacterized protein n=1 Tax=Deinococcus multiflagellatus TaxID=1656887 RepID=A0ABW1ZKZ7_9DEIO|nr:hypothetical protein [Deinococcus multiflagellatus]MBZ9713917.1 hypothetical protein [Deinococcus multiflagellatus]